LYILIISESDELRWRNRKSISFKFNDLGKLLII
jgi:hypothetical protein